jgi:hypothetical protein
LPGSPLLFDGDEYLAALLVEVQGCRAATWGPRRPRAAGPCPAVPDQLDVEHRHSLRISVGSLPGREYGGLSAPPLARVAVATVAQVKASGLPTG